MFRSAFPHAVVAAVFRGARSWRAGACSRFLPPITAATQRSAAAPLPPPHPVSPARMRWAPGSIKPGRRQERHTPSTLFTENIPSRFPHTARRSTLVFTFTHRETKNCHPEQRLLRRRISTETPPQFQITAALAQRITRSSSPATLRQSLLRPSPGSSALAPPMPHAFPPTAARQTRTSP
jgi:hypothetical protein